MWNDDDRRWLYEQMRRNGVDTGSYADFTKSLENKEDRDWYYQKSISMGLNVGSADDFAGMMVQPSVKATPAASMPKRDVARPAVKQTTGRVDASLTPSGAGEGKKPEQGGWKPTLQQRMGMQMQLDGMMLQTEQSQRDFSTRMENLRKGNSLGAFAGEVKPDAATGKLERKFYTTRGDVVGSQWEQSRLNLKYRDKWEATTEEGRKHRERRMENDFETRVGGSLEKYDPENAAERAWQLAEERTAADRNKHNKRIWENYSALGGGREMRMMSSGETFHSNLVDHLTNHDLQKMADEAWNILGKVKQQSIINDMYGALRNRYPQATEEQLQQAAAAMAREQSDRRMYELAVAKNAPQSATEYFFRKAVGMNSLLNIHDALARSEAGTTGDWEAREVAEQQFDKNHKISGIAGTVAGFVFDPLTILSAGVGSGAVRGAVWLGGKAFGEAATRKFTTSLVGRLATGSTGGAFNFGTFEAGREAVNQLKWGGHRNPETGAIEDYSLGAVTGQFGHGLMMGAATGVVAPLLGNVSDKMVRATESTAGKVGIRAGELGVGTIAEGTIFSVPEWIEGERDAMDVWTDNMAMMAGFKAHHMVKSAPRVIGELALSKNDKAGFETRLRSVMDRRGDLALTKDEKNELDSRGYGDLRKLTEDYNRYQEEKEEYENARPNTTEPGRMLESEGGEAELPYNRFVELMNDNSVSEAARAKMYYYLTGRTLPMSTVMGSSVIENKDAEGNVTGYTVQSCGANGIITSRTFDSKKRADVEVNRINRQAELNGFDVGERQYDWQGDNKRMYEACEKVAEENGAPANMLFDLMKRKTDAMNGVELQWVEKIIEAYDGLGDKYGSSEVRTAINDEYGVDVDKAIRKERNRRSEQEQNAIDEYANRLFADIKRNNSEDTRRDEATDSPDTPPPASEEVTALLGLDNGAEPDDMSRPFRRGYDANRQERRDIAIGLALGDPNSADYAEMQEAWNGVVQRITEEADYFAAQRRETLNHMVHDDDGSVHPILLKEKDESGHDMMAYLVNGHVEMMPDGTMVNPEKSDKSVVIYDPATGERRMISPAADTGILSLGEITSAEEYEAGIEQKRQQSIQYGIDEAQGKIMIEPGDRIILPDGEEAAVIAVDADGENIVVGKDDGTQESVSRSELQRLADEQAFADYRERHGVTEEQPSGPVGQPAVDVPKGGVVQGAPSDYTEGMELTIRDEDGTEKPAMVMGRVRSVNKNGRFEYVPDENGSLVEYLMDDVVHWERIDKMNERVVSYVPVTEGTERPESPESPEISEDSNILEDAAVPESQEDVEVQERKTEDDETEEANLKPTALSRVPVDEQTGEPVFERADRETALDALYEMTGGNAENARAIVNAQLEQATKAVDALKKKAPKRKEAKLNGSPMQMLKAQQDADAAYNAAVEQYNAEVAAAEERLKAWTGVYTLMNERSRAVREQQEADRKAREAELHNEALAQLEEQKRVEAEKAAEQAAVGTHAVNPKLKAKWDAAPKLDGNANAITLEDGSTLRGHYVLTEAGAATASHDVGNAYEPTEGFPVDENGESVNDRDYKRDMDAQRIVQDMADNYDSRALQSPVIVSKDGIVLSGNNRTMSGEIAARQNTDQAYTEHLKEFGQMYGFTPDQVGSMQHPRVVFVPDDVLPYDARTFSRFNAESQKKQGKPEQAVKLGKVVPDNVFNVITGDISRYDRLSDYYADEKAVSNAISQLLGAGVINEMQLPELRTGNSLSAAGRELIENTLIGKVFQATPDAVRQLIAHPTLRQSVVMSLSEIAHNRTLSGSGYDLGSELAAAVDLVSRAKSEAPDIYKDGMPVSPYGRQAGLFDEEYGDRRVTNGVTLLLADLLNSGRPSELRKVIATYNQAAASPASGQLDMFSGGITTKEQLLKETLDHFRNATPREQQALVDAAVAERKRRATAATSEPNGRGEAIEQTENAAGGGKEAADGKPLFNDGRGGNGSLAGREQGDLAQAEEIDENGHPFVVSSDGTTVFGNIAENSGLKPAPIKLSVGFNKVDERGNNIGYGLLHIEAGHGSQILKAGYSSVAEFVEDVSRNYGEIRIGRNRQSNQTYMLLELHDEKHKRTLYVELSHDGKYWNVNSGGIFRNNYTEKNDIVWPEPTVGSSANTNTTEVVNSSAEAAKGETVDRGGNSSQPISSAGKGTTSVSDLPTSMEKKTTQVADSQSPNAVQAAVSAAESETNVEPTEGQKVAGNYKKGHVRIDGFDVSIEQPKGSVRRGMDADGRQWEQVMHNTYGYIRGTEGVDGDHIDVFLSDDPSQGDVFVVDQVNKDGSFDEHKVMYGFADEESARLAYLANYEEGWQGLGAITHVSKDEFKKWVQSSHRKTKPFSKYKSVKEITEDVDQHRTNVNGDGLLVDGNGNPLVLYHGTPNDVELSALEMGHSRDGEDVPARFNGNGISFTPDRIVAEDYATSSGSKGKVFEVHVTLKKPYFTVGVAGFSPEESKEFTDGLIARGYDGIINYANKYIRELGALPNEVIVFDIKSAKPVGGSQEESVTPLTDEEAVSIVGSMKMHATVAPSVEINDANWKEKVDTPIGVVKMGENQKSKLFEKGREQQYGMLLETLSNPDVVLEEKDKEQNMFHERPSSYLFVKTFKKEDGTKYVHFESVTVSQDGMEVSISSHIIRENQLKNKLKSDRLLYKATALDAPANTSAGQPIVGGSLSSAGKGKDKSGSVQTETGKSAGRFAKGESYQLSDGTQITIEKEIDHNTREISWLDKDGKKQTGGVSVVELQQAIRKPSENRTDVGAAEEDFPAQKSGLVEGAENAEGKSGGSGETGTRRFSGGANDEGSSEPGDVPYTIVATTYTNKKGKTSEMSLLKFKGALTVEQERAVKEFAKERIGEGRFAPARGWKDRESGGWMFRKEEDARKAAEMVGNEEAVADEQPLSVGDMASATDAEELKAVDEAIQVEQEPQTTPRYDYDREDNVYKNTLSGLHEALASSNGIPNIKAIEKQIRDLRKRAKTIEDGMATASGETIPIAFDALANLNGKRRAYEQFLSDIRKKMEETERDDAFASHGDVVLEEPETWIGKTFFTNGMQLKCTDVSNGYASFDNLTTFMGMGFDVPTVQKYMRNGEWSVVSAGKEKTNKQKQDNKTEERQEQPKQGGKKPKSKWVNDEDAERFEELRHRLRKKLLGQMNMGVDPEIFAIGVEMSYLMLKKGSRKFGEFAKNLIEALGDEVRPYVKSFYNGARDLPEMADYEKDMTPYEEVRSFDVMNFDKKGAKDMIATAEHVSREVAAEREASVATDKLKQQRNEQRKETEQEVAANTAAISSEAETVAGEAETLAETSSDEQALNGAVERVDETIDKVNSQLALLGYYEADRVKKDFNEAYGYMRNAEKKAVKDATKLADRLIDDLGLDRYAATHYPGRGGGSMKKRPLAMANIAPAGGDISIHLPLSEGRELYINIALHPTWGMGQDGIGDNLEVDSIMYRVDGDRYGENRWADADVTYADLLKGIQREAYRYLPGNNNSKKGEYHAGDKVEYSPDGGRTWHDAVVVQPNDEGGVRIDTGQAPVMYVNAHLDQLRHKVNEIGIASPVSAPSGEDIFQQAERISKENARNQAENSTKEKKSKKKSETLQQQTIPDLFSGLFDEDESVKHQDENNNGLQRVHELRSERPATQGNQQGEHTQRRGETPEQESRRTDGRGEDGSIRASERPVGHVSRLNDTAEGTRKARYARLEPAPASSSERKNTRNNHAERGTDYAPKSTSARIEANIEAIETMQRLIESGQPATPEDMSVLRKFSGWGGLGAAFKEKDGWKQNPVNKRLRELLSPDAYEAANMSRNSAYYTPAPVIDAMWDVARAMGFRGGNVLEGSAGIGNILGLMPTDMSDRSNIHAVEIDETTGNILSLLYPDANVEVKGFEKTHVANGSVDLAITNVPFVTGLRVMDETGDKDLSRKFHDIHDFCIAKNVRKLKEGGIGIFITSSGTLDSPNSAKLRAWLVNEGCADVVGAFRLHNQTFGGTGATSDIIVIRKRVNGRRSANAIDVSGTLPIRTVLYNTGETKRGSSEEIVKELALDVNKHFVEHPEDMAGEMAFAFEKGDTYRATSRALYPSPNINQEQRLAEWAKQFNDMDWDKSEERWSEQVVYEDLGEDVKEGSMLLDRDGNLCLAQRGKAVPIGVNSNKVKGHTKAECFTAYKAIKDALADVLEYQTTHNDDNGLKQRIDALNRTYDQFVKTYGHLNKNTAISFLRSDMDYPSIAALESVSETGDKSGKRVVTYGKTDIFSRRVVETESEPKPTTIKDGIIASIYLNGRVDVPYIAEQLGIIESDVRQQIIENGLGFENPTTTEMEVSYEYLSGNVREKLRQAQENNADGKYDSNIRALERVLPMNIPAHLIEFTLGSSWVDPKLYEDYVKERTGLAVKLTNAGGTWIMNEPYWTDSEMNKAMGVISDMCDKTILGHELIKAAITCKSISVTKTVTTGYGSNKTTETIVDKEATMACANKIDEIRQDFKDWARDKMQGDPEMSERMERVYNELFNNSVPMEIPEEFVPEHFGGAATVVNGKPFQLRPHQAKSVIRGTTQALFLAHEVGSGKTYTLISTAMEMRRLGTARKPMIVVQNSTVGQFVKSAKELYPNAKILTLEDADRNADGRRNFYAKIRYNDWDMIVVPQSVFQMIPDSEERQIRFVEDKIEEKMMVLEKMREAASDERDPVLRQAERELEKLEEERNNLQITLNERKSGGKTNKDEKREAKTKQNAMVKAQEMLDRETDDVDNFDDMGIDALLIDEAHEYKHLGFATAMQRGVKGVDPSYSKKSQGVYLKTQAVLEKNNGKNVVFATGTPISNTAAEIWTFMRYLMPADTMREYGIYYFDDFVRNFGSIQQMMEFSTNGKYKENNRFSGYVNLPELVRIWSGITDTVLNKEVEAQRIAEGGESQIPEMEGGKAQDIYLPQTKALRSVMKYVKEQLDEYEQMSGKEKKENSHIPLTMYGIAQAAAVDPRLVLEDAADEPDSKTNEAVRQTLHSLEESKDYNGTVAIFSDRYQNKATGFNLYDDIRKKLIDAGVPDEQVVVVNPNWKVKKKLEVFERVNRGEVRVIMGSTFTLGTGVNIQERLHTLIHVDAPNRPMDYTQRNGRILRQGNLHKEWGVPVRVLRFGVEDSLDVTAYQRLKTKGAIADSIMEGKKMMHNSMENRVLEEEQDLFGDITAQLSGSQYALLKNQVEKEVKKLEARKKQYEADQTYVHNQKQRLKGLIREAAKRAERNRSALAKVESANMDGITIGKMKFPTLESMSDYIRDYNRKQREQQEQVRTASGYKSEAKSDLTVNVGGIDFHIHRVISKEQKQEKGQLSLSFYSKTQMTYSCPELGLEDVPVEGQRLKSALEDIVNNVVSGDYFRERLETAERAAERYEGELQQVEARDGKPFEYADELKQAKEKLAEYEELMKAEMAEKEAKYAEMDADVEAAKDVQLSDDESYDAEDTASYRLGEDDALDAVNERFNSQLGSLTEENKDRVVLSLGRPSAVLLSAGVEDKPMKLYGNKVIKKMKKHGFALDELYNLPAAVADPIAVFDNIGREGNRSILTELKTEQGNFLVTVDLGKGEDDIDFNIISSVFGKSDNKVVDWINKGLATYINKEKALNYLHHSAPIAEALSNPRLDSAANVVRNFVNPKVEGGENSGMSRYSGTLRFSGGANREGRTMRKGDGAMQQDADGMQKGADGMQLDAGMKRRTAEQIGAKLNTPINIIENIESITHSNPEIQARRRNSKGWYDPSTSEVYVVLDNNRDVEDVAATVAHETIAHKGLREMIGDERYNEFLDEVYAHLRDDLKKGVDAAAGRSFMDDVTKNGKRAKSYGKHRRTATDELFGRMAEKPFEEFNEGERTLWQNLKDTVRRLLDKFLASLKLPKWFELGDNELRYILWRSKERLERGNEHPIDVARDIVKREELGLSEDNAVYMESGKKNSFEPKPVGHGFFGNVYNQFKGKVMHAVKFLSKHESGDLLGVFHRKDVGDIDMVWGDEGGGLCHILNKHINDKDFPTVKELVSRIEDIVNNGVVDFSNGDKIVLKKDGYVVTIRRNIRDKGKKIADKNWVLTAYNKDAPANTQAPADGTHGSTAVAPGTSSDAKEAILSEINEISDENVAEDGALYRDDETEDIWKDGSMGLAERTTLAKLRLSNKHKEDKTLRNDAMREIGGNLSDLRRAMGIQREFDRTTVKRVHDLARVLISSGYLSGMSANEVTRLLAAVKNSVGHNDIDASVQKVMDIMVDHQLKNGEAALHSLETIRGSKVDARGVEVQGQLDADGQTMMKAFKEAKKIVEPCAGEITDKDGELTAWGIALEDVQERMISDDVAVAEAAALEYSGMQMAQQWFDGIVKSKLEEATIRKELKQSHDDTSERDRATDSYRQYVASVEEAIRQNKIERAQAYFDLVGRLSDSLRESIANAKDFKEAEKRRIREIQHNANSDMEGRPSDEHQMPADTRKKLNNLLGNSLFAPLATYMEMLRMFGSKSVNGEGYLFNRFGRGWIDARQKEIRGVRVKYAQLDAKAAELFGGKVKTWGDLIMVVGKLPKCTVSFWNGGEMKDVEIGQGNLMYIYMVNKMLDGRMKLRKMGISEEDVSRIENVLDPRLTALADWLQEEFLVQTRNEYNETHKRMFGASMAAIENYFPLRVLKNSLDVKAEDLDKPDVTDGISTATGSIIKRRRNSKPLDILNADALHVVLSHVAEMEHWNAYAEFKRDLNTLRSYKRFRNQVMNMVTIYGNGKNLWDKFNDVCQLAAGTYKPKGDDKSFLTIAQGATAAAVSFRLYTAMKQLASMPAYIPYVRIDYMAKSMMDPYGSWKWCMDNLPIFEERWKSRVSGDPRLVKSFLTAADWRQNLATKLARAGMASNAFVDALTCSMGAYAVYQTRKGQYLRDGYSEELAERRAIQDAEMVYNETQQSGEDAFVSTMQRDISYVKTLFTIFRNASMAYQRQLHGALRDLNEVRKTGIKGRVEFVTKQLLRDKGIQQNEHGEWNEEDYMREERIAKRKVRRQFVKDGLAIATFGGIMQLAWNICGYLPYLLFGDDDDTKEEFWDDIWTHTMGGWLEGLTGGDVMSLGIGMWISGDYSEWKLNKEMPFTTALIKTGSDFVKGDYGAFVTNATNLLIQTSVGVNPQSITDRVLAIMDACGDDPALANEATLCIMRIMSVPQSQIDKLYFDEVGLRGDEVSNYTPAQLAERYAAYKVKQGNFFSPWSWDDEELIGKFKEKASQTIKERTERADDPTVNEDYERSAEMYKNVDAQVKSARKAVKDRSIDVVQYAEAMRNLQSDAETWRNYNLFKNLDKNLDGIVKKYLGAKSPEEAALCRKAVNDYKSCMVRVMNASSEEERRFAMQELSSMMQDFAQKYGPMQQPNR